MTNLDKTHDTKRRSWVQSANSVEGQPESDFPIQNLPHGVFRRKNSQEEWRGGIAIGDQILDIRAAILAGLMPVQVKDAAQMAAASSLNDYMGITTEQRRGFRNVVSDLLVEGSPHELKAAACLVPQSEVEYSLPARINNFSDFYSSIHHATNVGALFRPDNPILPNYRWLPVGYTGRTSSIRVSGYNATRPHGQIKSPEADAPTYEPCKRLDYEVELGILVGRGNQLGTPISIKEADEHVFGVCLLNDWSARDIQSWEYQPLGPMLSKSFLTSLSPWVVTMEALEPYRTGFSRPEGDPSPLPHLWCEELRERGSIDIRIQMFLQTQQMRDSSTEPVMISDSKFTDSYWALAQLIAHQTSNGSNLLSGDLLGSGTLSGKDPASRACLLELTQGGKNPISLPNGEKRAFLEDGDTVIMRGYCQGEGAVRIGFGECRSTVMPATQL